MLGGLVAERVAAVLPVARDAAHPRGDEPRRRLAGPAARSLSCAPKRVARPTPPGAFRGARPVGPAGPRQRPPPAQPCGRRVPGRRRGHAGRLPVQGRGRLRTRSHARAAAFLRDLLRRDEPRDLHPPDVVQPLGPRALRPRHQRRDAVCGADWLRIRRAPGAWPRGHHRGPRRRGGVQRLVFRAGNELFYTPFLPSDKRAAKSIIDVGADRFGDAVAGGLVAVLLILGPSHHTAILGAAMGCSAGALLLTRRLRRGYVSTLERSLLTRAVELDAADVGDRHHAHSDASGAVRHRCSRSTAVDCARPASRDRRTAARRTPSAPTPTSRGFEALPSHDPGRVLAVLGSDMPLSAALATHVIPLLAWDPVAHEAVVALRRVADEHIGQLTDALVDQTQPFAVRRRLARVLSACTAQRAVDGLLLGLDDSRFEVRFECARSLAAIVEKHPDSRLERDHLLAVVRREVGVSRHVWESRSSSISWTIATRPHWSTNSSGAAPVEAWRTSSRCCRWCFRPSRCASRFAACTPMSDPARHRARVSGRHAAAGHPRTAVGVPGGSAAACPEPAPPAGDSG